MALSASPQWLPVPVVDGAYTDDTIHFSSQDIVNLIPERASLGGARTGMMAKQLPGLLDYVYIGDGPIRGMRNVEGRLFAVSAGALYQVFNDATNQFLGYIPGDGRVSISHNQITGGNEVIFVTGNAGYVWNTVTSTLVRITDAAYPGSIVVDYIDSYLAQVEPSKRYWFHSDLAAATSYLSTDTYQAEAAPDLLSSLIVDHRQVWAMGLRTIEVYDNTGGVNSAFTRVTVIEKGNAGAFTCCKLDNSIFWLGTDGILYRANGYVSQRISTYAIEQAIAKCNLANAFMTTWEDRGHAVVYLTFPDGHTWGYDVSTQLFHRRESYGLNRWRVNTLEHWNGSWYAGDYQTGKIYSLNWDVYAETNTEILRELNTGVLHDNGNRLKVFAVEVLTGEALSKGFGQNETLQYPYPEVAGPACATVYSWADYSQLYAASIIGVAFNSNNDCLMATQNGGKEYSITNASTWAVVDNTPWAGSVGFTGPYVSCAHFQGSWYISQLDGGVSNQMYLFSAPDNGTFTFTNVYTFTPILTSTCPLQSINGNLVMMDSDATTHATFYLRGGSDAIWTTVILNVAQAINCRPVNLVWTGSEYLLLITDGVNCPVFAGASLTTLTYRSTMAGLANSNLEINDTSTVLLCRTSSAWRKSVDGGYTWTSTGAAIVLYSLAFFRDACGPAWYAAAYNITYKSTDDGATWAVVHTGAGGGSGAIGFMAKGNNSLLTAGSNISFGFNRRVA